MPEDLIETWKADADQIGIDLNNVWTQWTHAKALMTALEQSPRASQHHEAFYLRTFVFKAIVDQIVLGVRRQVDPDKDSHSFVNFLTALVKQPDAYSLDECIATFLERAGRWGFEEPTRSNYEQQARVLYEAVADASGNGFDQNLIRQDIKLVRKLCSKMKVVANKHVAHNDRDKPEHQLTILELENTLNVLKIVMRKYCRLFDGGGDGTGEPDMEEMLSLYRFAWLEPAV